MFAYEMNGVNSHCKHRFCHAKGLRRSKNEQVASKSKMCFLLLFFLLLLFVIAAVAVVVVVVVVFLIVNFTLKVHLHCANERAPAK